MPSGGDRYADLLPYPQGERASRAGSGSDQAEKLRQIVPTVTGVGPLGQTMACLEMLARFHNIPFRRDVIERAAQDNLANRKATSLELLGNLASAMGFTCTLVSLPEAKLARAPFPCIAWIEDQPSVLFSITKGSVKASFLSTAEFNSFGSLVGGSTRGPASFAATSKLITTARFSWFAANSKI